MKTEEEIEQLIDQLKSVCSELGWLMSFNETSDAVYGMVIGTEEYIENLLQGGEDFNTYEIFQMKIKKRELH